MTNPSQPELVCNAEATTRLDCKPRSQLTF